MKHLLAFAVLLLTLAGFATAGTLTGTLAYPNTAITLNNATLTFALSQPAYVSGSFLVIPQSVSCYTTSAPGGSVVGLPDPIALPTVTPDQISGSLPNGTYYVEISYWFGSGGAGAESLPSPEQVVSLAGAGELTINGPALQPANATGYNVYIGTSSGSEKLQDHVTGFGNDTRSTPLSGAGATPLATNTVPCTLRFTDELIPSGTWYNTTIATSNGSTLPGFPQRWQLWGGSGATINLSNGFPTSFQTTLFPTPIQANPANSSSQSINSPLNIGGRLTVNTGIVNNGTGFQHKRVTGCTAAASQCNTTLIWNTAFSDTNYTTTCSYISAGQAAHPGNVSKSANQLVVSVYAETGNVTGPGELDCIAVHD